ncbi:cytochrome C [Algoriphagus sediminis]|uniref:Cytochrome C n=1 Tax=Algoriphagus sediminis TaxID=3057113 RepID=A0ABT7YGG5_9BACT|nr:cytochrome C [Algoriphagus sediminis]MDN3205615.1 cytochrome C [Algoriphagus sediminis]
MKSSPKKEFSNQLDLINGLILSIFVVLLLFLGVLGYAIFDPSFSRFSGFFNADSDEKNEFLAEVESEEVVDGIHVETGFIDAPGMVATIQNCTGCHSSSLVIANRMNEERWIETIRWMQETQNLWDLGENEKVIVDYLVTNYPPKKIGRRANLENIEWYELED